MSNNLNSSGAVSPLAVGNLHGLVWNADLTLQQDGNAAALERRQAIDRARAARPRTAQIEREIMVAVIVLYALILGSFAALHLYGIYLMPDQDEQVVSVEQGGAAAQED
ncbi:MAG: hypothetical protein RBR29_03495 [Castellaniella sp.]|uniref:hypothetical protein n=1 Tax=Castellaniella sp. TaxID=1955812 RepID=UPI002A36AD38|nr:hypothetical protein [Castellaniella sp.]MDY0308843.1 hypothetical protein [Castellaniella sp.]